MTIQHKAKPRDPNQRAKATVDEVIARTEREDTAVVLHPIRVTGLTPIEEITAPEAQETLPAMRSALR